MEYAIRRIYAVDESRKPILETFKTESFITDTHYYFGSEDIERLISEISNQSQAGMKTRQPEQLIIENVQALSGLGNKLWVMLRCAIKKHEVILVVMDIPTTWVKSTLMDKEASLLVSAVMTDVIDAIYNEKSRVFAEKQQAGIKKAQAAGVHIGRTINVDMYKKINKLLAVGRTYKEIEGKLGCSSRTIVKAKKWAAGEGTKKTTNRK